MPPSGKHCASVSEPLDPAEPVVSSPVELELLELVSVSAAPLEVTLAVGSVLEPEPLLVEVLEELLLLAASDVDPPEASPLSSPQAMENTKRKLRQAERDRDMARVYVSWTANVFAPRRCES